MRLTTNGKVVANAGAADVQRALASRRGHGDWSIRLARSDTDWIEGRWTVGDSYRVRYAVGGVVQDVSGHVAGADLRHALNGYLAGRGDWRSRLIAAKAADVSGETAPEWIGRLKTWLPGVVLLFAVMAESYWSIWNTLGAFLTDGLRLPAAIDSIQARVILGFFAACVGLFLVATLVKLFEVRSAKTWQRAMGRIVSSREVFKLERPPGKGLPTNRRVPEIKYEFVVGDQTFRGSRVSFAEKVGEDEVVGVVARYPAGARVEVYYDPRRPTSSTLQRDFDGSLATGCLLMFVVGLVAVVLLMAAATHAPGLVRAWFPDAVVPLVMFFGCAGVFIALIAAGVLKDQVASRRWPKVMGRITTSSVAYAGSDEGAHRYMPIVEYEYSVGGQAFASRNVWLDSEVGGSEAFAAGISAKYPEGKLVPVIYDPARPNRAALEIRHGLGVGLVVLAAVLLLIAAWAAGVFTDGPPLTKRG